MRRAFIGDIHNSITLLKELYQKLKEDGVDEIYHAGDLIDRGEDPEAVIRFCMENNLRGVKGNHDEALLRKHILPLGPPRAPDKRRSYDAIMRVDGAVEYLLSLPPLIVFEDSKSILVHAGVNPYKTLEQQNSMCCYISMVNEKEPGVSRWWGTDRKGRTEEQNRLEGWERWYNLYAFPYDVYRGHMGAREPHIHPFPKSPGKKLISIDTSAWYTGMLTAAVVNENGFEKFVSTPKLRETEIEYEI